MKRWVQFMLRQHTQPGQIFCALDTDHDGRLSYEELGRSISLTEPNCLQIELDQICESMDPHRIGFITEAQLLAAIESCDSNFARGELDPSGQQSNGQQNGGLPGAQGFDIVYQLPPSHMELIKRWVRSMRRLRIEPRDMFDALDQDGDGRLSYKELAHFFQLLEPSCMEMDLVQTFKSMDVHKVGFVTRSSIASRLRIR